MSSKKSKNNAPVKFFDYTDESEGHFFRIESPVVTRKTKYQKIVIKDIVGLGRVLVLDGATQSFEFDEHIYHEALMQPGLCAHPAPKRVLIIGGGEGASAREALRHPSVEEVVMVDLDGEVVDLCKKYLQKWHEGAFDNPKFKLIIGDGHAYMLNETDQFDVIIIDVVDSFDGGPAEALYSTKFYEATKKRLTSNGVLVIQGMELDSNEYQDHCTVRKNIAGVFKHVRSYNVYVPTFWSEWGYIFASDSQDPLTFSVESIDKTIADRGLTNQFKFYDGRAHQRLFSLGKDIRKLLGEI